MGRGDRIGQRGFGAVERARYSIGEGSQQSTGSAKSLDDEERARWGVEPDEEERTANLFVQGAGAQAQLLETRQLEGAEKLTRRRSEGEV